ncbi:hypothetical protein JK359_16255 [Streptomyces actinomycinicus]|uniref:Uncharacterized protein n=1 Tax=Streptomyces actinomycinicus TaxID=1695166 RepID=A0A937EJG5_9ACTN|nr:hypothetical protein [Streptomyces actinomycinicus]MBL1083507.1 hypothetical protein [Streptomyces actinomycinicus]
MSDDRPQETAVSNEPGRLSLYDELAEVVDFADAPERTTTMAVETTDGDPFCL